MMKAQILDDGGRFQHARENAEKARASATLKDQLADYSDEFVQMVAIKVQEINRRIEDE